MLAVLKVNAEAAEPLLVGYLEEGCRRLEAVSSGPKPNFGTVAVG